jgi:DNA adenine methylase
MATNRGGILRYPGSKYRVRKILADFFRSESPIYTAFLGGAHVELELCKRLKDVIAFDVYLRFINFWKIAQKYAEDFADYIQSHYLGRMTRSLFYALQVERRHLHTGSIKAYEAVKKSDSGRKGIRRLRSPIRRFGAKTPYVGKLLPYIWKYDHHVYAESFMGGAALLFAKTPSPVEIINDIDGGVVNLFRVLQDPLLFEEFHRLVSLTPYSREFYYHCRNHWKAYTDPCRRAWAYFIASRQSFSSDIRGGWSHVVKESKGGVAGSVQRWLSIIELLPQISERLLRVQIERLDFRKFLPKYDGPETLYYHDPPYVPSTRTAGGYEHEMTEEDHEELVEILLGLQGKSILSGYANPIYERLEHAGWARHDYDVACHASGKSKKPRRVESIWLSPGLPANSNK